ncbi:peroxiredoxin-like family protein [Ferrimonas balearica]|uniref:peroxiredoxin-like family protein n=1 Tax=Ferrimonas balearica TaxID=44012 RepID=UPI001C994E8D|nr:peroxiredoxin-like family protein [Ferrimonas balearica]MBY5993690.1 AhpC/TSA family protein [Ferrimonas balearica]
MQKRTLSGALLALCLTLVAPLAQAEIAASPEQVSPLLNGMMVPDIQVQNSDGQALSLNAQMAGKPSLVLFYRGGWCPYCNAQLAGLQEIEQELDKLGVQVLALSPEPPAKLKEGEGKGQYQLLSDRDLEATLGFGLAYTLDAPTGARYKGKMGDRLKLDEQERVVLPVPAAYLIDAEGRVQFSYVNPSYQVRVHPQLLLTAARLMLAP